MDNNKIKAVIFDMDGVIVDSEPLHFEAHKKALEKFGIELSLEDYMDFGVAQGDDNLYEKAAQKFDIKIDKEEISKLKKRIYREIFDQKAELRVGVLELIKILCKKYDLAIASSGTKDVVNHVVERFSLGDYFKVIVTGDDVERVKPYPDIYIKASQLLYASENECIALEDSETGVSAAKSAGIRCIAVPCDFTRSQNLSKADLILDDLEEVTNKLF